MTSKIDIYREVLNDDPNSRVFFSLAKMLAEQGDAEEAVTILERSMGFHPGHLEARFLLVELLTRLGREDEAAESFEGLSSLLSSYPSVWTLWASRATGLSKDSSLALKFLALALGGKDVSWSSILEKGIQAASSESGGSAVEPSAEPVPPAAPEGFSLRGADEVMALTQRLESQERLASKEHLPPECTSTAVVKTRTMADLLARHGDYSSALEIYGELLRLATSEGERDSLAGRIQEIESQMAAGVPPSRVSPGQPPKSRAKLVSMLEALANRLDARAIA